MTIFVNNETLVFGYSKFKLIDTGVKYINPKHFSVKNFVKYCRFNKELNYSKIKDSFFVPLLCHCSTPESFLPSPAGTSQIIPDIFDTLHPGVDLAVMSETKGEALPLPQHTERYRQIFSRQNAVLITSVFP